MIKLRDKLKAFWDEAFDEGFAVGVTYLGALALGLGFLIWGFWAIGTFVGKAFF